MSAKMRLNPDQPASYRITVQGKLPENWNDFFAEMTPTTHTRQDGLVVTLLSGEVVDQSSLHGLLRHIHDLGLPLLDVKLLSTPIEGEKNMFRTRSFNSVFYVALKGIALAMAVAAVVLTILKSASNETLITLLTIGLAALALSALDKD